MGDSEGAEGGSAERGTEEEGHRPVGLEALDAFFYLLVGLTLESIQAQDCGDTE